MKFRLRFPRVRFSLATLLLAVLLGGSGVSLGLRWGPWVKGITVRVDFQAGCLSPDSKSILTVTRESAQICDARSGELKLNLRLASPNHLRCGFTPNGRLFYLVEYSPGSNLITRKYIRRVCFYDAASGESFTRLDFGERSLFRISISSSGQHMATIDSEEVRLWNLQSGHNEVLFSYKPYQPNSVVFSSDEKHLFITLKTGLLWKFDLNSKRATEQFSFDPKQGAAISHSELLVACAVSDDARSMWSYAIGDWEIQANAMRRLGLVIPPKTLIEKFAFAPDDSRILAKTDDKDVLVFDGRSGALLARFDIVRERFSLGSEYIQSVEWTNAGEIVVFKGPGVDFYHRTRPEYWWGVFCLPDFWTTVLLAGIMVWRAVKGRGRNLTDENARPTS